MADILQLHFFKTFPWNEKKNQVFGYNLKVDNYINICLWISAKEAIKMILVTDAFIYH